MGMTFEKDIEHYFPNGTKCMNWQDVKISHESSVTNVVINSDDIHGLIILLAVGLIAATITSISEWLRAAQKRKAKIVNKNQLPIELDARESLKIVDIYI